MKNYAIYFLNPHHVEVQEQAMPIPTQDEVLIKNRFSGISAGTEMLFYRGLVPTEMAIDATIPGLHKPSCYPFKYGYASVGEVVEVGHKKLNPLLNQSVFAFNPHESYFCVKETNLTVLPSEFSNSDAVFLPQMETAINLLLDSAPLIGENVLILGLGIIGFLTCALLSSYPLNTILALDLYAKRRQLGQELGITTFDAANPATENQIQQKLSTFKHTKLDLIFELTGNPNSINQAIQLASYETRIILGSWYGKKTANLELGGKFHRERIKIISSQVSTIASELTGRWTKKRRFDLALDMLKKIQPSRIISHQFQITEAKKAYEVLDKKPQDVLQVILTYENE